MSKSKLFAIIISAPILGAFAFAYAQTSFAPPTLVITKPAQPTPSIAPAGALYVPFTKVDLTARGADIIVSEITVEQTGLGDAAAFDELVLLDSDGEEHGDGSFNSDGLVRFKEPIYIPRDTTLHLTVAANMAEDLEEFVGQIPSLTIIDIQASGYVPVHL